MTNLKQTAAPLYEAVIAYANAGAAAFHTPGHKQGRGAADYLRRLITADGLRGEVSLADELDDPFCPSGCIKAAQELAAALFGARETIFSAQGTTGAIQTMLLAALNPGDEVLVSRGAHRSVLAALVLTGARPVYIDPAYDAAADIALNVTPDAVARAVSDHPRARAAVIVTPSYYGVAADTAAIAAIVHAAGMLLLVDEAHGAHLPFAAELPPSAIEAGADLVAQSTHKLLGSLTETSMLHVGRAAPPDMAARVYRAYSVVMTTSPNYLLLASLDIARRQMAESGASSMARLLAAVKKLRHNLAALPGIKLFAPPEDFAFDPTKIAVDFAGLGITGAAAWRYLRGRGLQPELCDGRRVLFLLSYADDDATLNKIFAGVAALAEEHGGEKRAPRPLAAKFPPAPKNPAPLTPRQAFFAPTMSVPLRAAAGRLAGEAPLIYPPGIPIFYPGEVITQAALDYLAAARRAGLTASGTADPTLKTILVLDDRRSD